MYSRFRLWHHCPCDDLTSLMGRIHPDLSYCSLLLSCKGEDMGRKREERKGMEGEGKNAGRKEEKKKRTEKAKKRKKNERGGREEEKKGEKETT